MKKRILLVMPDHVGLITQIKSNLEHYGFEVCAYSGRYLESNFQYPNLSTHIRILLSKYLFNNRTEKENLKKVWITQQLTKHLSEQLFDYTLVIRPDLLSIDSIQVLRQHTQHILAAYQWDGFDRYAGVADYVQLFDRFFVFDYNDIVHHADLSLLGITNFYFDANIPNKLINKNNSAYFVGSHINERIAPINYCADTLTNLGIKVNFIISTRKNKHKKCYKNKNITFINKQFDFKTNLENVVHSDILLDFVNPVHQGLSFRIFEALYYQKKLITNNPSVKNYDFYHPNNIFIWNGADLSGLSEFLKRPLQPINQEIVEKYSFGNWIKNIFDLSPYQAIKLPKISPIDQNDTNLSTLN